MDGDSDQDDRVGLGSPMLWGFLSTLLLGALGFLCALAGAWPLLWLPLFAPAFAFVYVRLRLHNSDGFGRFLTGYGICLTVLIVLMFLYIVAVT
jgi:hypothetical protein